MILLYKSLTSFKTKIILNYLPTHEYGSSQALSCPYSLQATVNDSVSTWDKQGVTVASPPSLIILVWSMKVGNLSDSIWPWEKAVNFDQIKISSSFLRNLHMYTIKGETDHQPRLDAWDKRSDLVLWEDLEGAGGDGGGWGDRDGEYM